MLPFVPVAYSPFKILFALNRANRKAGYKPDNKTIQQKAIPSCSKMSLFPTCTIDKSRLNSWLKNGRNNFIKKNASNKLNRHWMPISIRNWAMIFCLVEPSTFLIPTSFALFNDFARDRLLKLMQPLTNNKMESIKIVI